MRQPARTRAAATIRAALAGWALAALALAWACASPPVPAAEEYFPLDVGRAWVYQVTSEGPADGLLQVLVADVVYEAEGPRYVVYVFDASLPPEDRDPEVGSYEVGEKGVYCEACEGRLLAEPLREGASWSDGTSALGESTILDTNATVTVAGREYDRALVVERREVAAERRVVSTYAPGVGLVRARYYRLGEGAADDDAPYREEVLIETGRHDPPRYLRPVTDG